MRTRIWNNLTNIKFKAYYCSKCSVLSGLCSKVYSFILSFISTVSVAAWTIWGEYYLVWANVVAFSQLLHLSRPYMPFISREKEFLSASYAFEMLYLEYERLWHDIESAKKETNNIEEIFYQFRQKEIEIEKNYNGASFPDIDFLVSKALKDTNSFLALNFEMEGLDEQRENNIITKTSHSS